MLRTVHFSYKSALSGFLGLTLTALCPGVEAYATVTRAAQTGRTGLPVTTLAPSLGFSTSRLSVGQTMRLTGSLPMLPAPAARTNAIRVAPTASPAQEVAPAADLTAVSRQTQLAAQEVNSVLEAMGPIDQAAHESANQTGEKIEAIMTGTKRLAANNDNAINAATKTAPSADAIKSVKDMVNAAARLAKEIKSESSAAQKEEKIAKLTQFTGQLHDTIQLLLAENIGNKPVFNQLTALNQKLSALANQFKKTEPKTKAQPRSIDELTGQADQMRALQAAKGLARALSRNLREYMAEAVSTGVRPEDLEALIKSYRANLMGSSVSSDVGYGGPFGAAASLATRRMQEHMFNAMLAEAQRSWDGEEMLGKMFSILDQHDAIVSSSDSVETMESGVLALGRPAIKDSKLSAIGAFVGKGLDFVLNKIYWVFPIAAILGASSFGYNGLAAPLVAFALILAGRALFKRYDSFTPGFTRVVMGAFAGVLTTIALGAVGISIPLCGATLAGAGLGFILQAQWHLRRTARMK
jgi:hypothetical protein